MQTSWKMARFNEISVRWMLIHIGICVNGCFLARYSTFKLFISSSTKRQRRNDTKQKNAYKNEHYICDDNTHENAAIFCVLYSVKRPLKSVLFENLADTTFLYSIHANDEFYSSVQRANRQFHYDTVLQYIKHILPTYFFPCVCVCMTILPQPEDSACT